MEIKTVDNVTTVTDKPFWKRSEFWVSLITSLVGLFASGHSDNQTLKDIGGVAATAAPLVYTFGRMQVKKSVATGLINAFANAVSTPDDPKGS